MEQQEQLDQKSEVREKTLKTALDLRKHKDSIAELSGIRSGIDKLNQLSRFY